MPGLLGTANDKANILRVIQCPPGSDILTDNRSSRSAIFVEGREELRSRNRQRAALRNRGHDIKRNLVRRRAPLHVIGRRRVGNQLLTIQVCSRGCAEGRRALGSRRE